MTETKELCGTVLSCVGGLYTVLSDEGENIKTRARGIFRYEKKSPLPGDLVLLRGVNGSFTIEKIFERKNMLSRPSAANIDTLFISFSPLYPTPNTLCIDRLICVAETAKVGVAIAITKSDLSRELSEKYKGIYEKAGFPVFVTSSEEKYGTEEIKNYIKKSDTGKIFAFAGASGIGKSSLMNTLFPFLKLQTGALSEKTARGKQTTRTVELFPVTFQNEKTFFVADTPGFSSLDFSSVPNFGKEQLIDTFHDFSPFTDDCRYRDCTHTNEEECGVISAVKRGDIAKSRHDSFLIMYNELSKSHYKK